MAEQETQSVAVKKKKIGVKAAIGIAVAAVVVGGAYVAACATVDQSTILGQTEINGVELKDMTRDEAIAALDQDYEKAFGTAKLQVKARDALYDVEIAKALTLDTAAVVDQAMEFGHGSFLTRGAAKITSLMHTRTHTALPTVGDAAALRAAVDASGLMEIDTTVQTTWEKSEDKLTFVKGTTGVSVDEDKLLETLTETINGGSFDTVVEAPMVSGTVKAVDLQALYDETYVQVADATLDKDNGYEIVPSVDGVSFDIMAAQTHLDTAAEGDTVEVPLEFTAPKINTELMKQNLFRDKLGTYSTGVTGSAARKSNVRLAAKKCNNVILLPGETFSYNGTVGQRTKAAGFQEAGAYLNGQTVQELGGGICQTSSTLYNAVLLANLEITERYNHSYVSSYVPLGQDATVSWGGPDFKFTNNTEYPIKVVTSYSGDRVYCSIYGTNLTGNYVKVTNEVLSTNSYTTIEKKSSELYVGQTKVEVSGYNGAKAQTYRSVYSSDGTLISKTKEAYSNYKTRNCVVLVGTKVKPVAPPAEQKPAETPAGGTGTDAAGTQTPAQTPAA